MKLHPVNWFLILVFIAGIAIGFANYRPVTFNFLFTEREYYLGNLLAIALSVGFVLGIVAGITFRRGGKKGVVLNLASDKSSPNERPSQKNNSFFALTKPAEFSTHKLYRL